MTVLEQTAVQGTHAECHYWAIVSALLRFPQIFFCHFCVFSLLTLVAHPPIACTSNSSEVGFPQTTGAQVPCITQNFGVRHNPEFSHGIRPKLPSLEHHLKSFPCSTSSSSLSSFSPSFIVSPGSTSLINHSHIHSHLRVYQTYDRHWTVAQWSYDTGPSLTIHS